MILQANRRTSTTAPLRQASTDGPEEWGHWAGRKHYSLEVVQHPLRARMCGFGDKDRRPLAPAAVAKMIVRREDETIVDVDDVDCSFFLVTVDLWSGDGKQETNLVLHPSSTDRYVPTQPKPRRRGTSTSTPHNTGHQTPSRSTPAPSQFSGRGRDSQAGGGLTPIIPPQTPAFSSPGSYFPSSDSMEYQQTNSYGVNTSEPPVWGYSQSSQVDRNTTFPPPVLPSIHSFGRPSGPNTNTNTGGQWHADSAVRDEAEANSYRSWNAESSFHVDNQPATSGVFESPSTPNVDGSGWNQASMSNAPETNSQQYPPTSQSGTSEQHSIYASASYAQHAPQGEFYASTYPSGAPPSSAIAPLPRHTYTRTLVGPLSANACRLLDEHRKPGIFFLFQDLSVRTEGTFRLRMRLMNVGAPPAPDQGAIRVHTDVSPVLAQTFTEPFIVYSAKRFPGVPDTTALSIAFGNQGQKLPLRNRHGSSKRRRRGGSDSEDDDSDGA